MQRLATTAFFIAALFLLTAAGIAAVGKLPWLVLWMYLVLSVVTFCVYGWDKLAAVRTWQRTRENTLHLLSLLGGWPGALYAQQLFRHKSAKKSFRIVFWVTAALNLTLFGYLLTDSASWLVAILRTANDALWAIVGLVLPHHQ